MISLLGVLFKVIENLLRIDLCTLLIGVQALIGLLESLSVFDRKRKMRNSHYYSDI